jgi:type IV pilus assembly protein PilE
MRRKNAGVTLIELLLVVVIIGILTAISIPAYRKYVARANRSDAKAALMATAGALERCFTRYNSYAEADGCAVEMDVLSTEGHYRITAGSQTATEFALIAAPVDGQRDDTACGSFTLNSANVKGVTGSKTAHDCWSR